MRPPQTLTTVTLTAAATIAGQPKTQARNDRAGNRLATEAIQAAYYPWTAAIHRAHLAHHAGRARTAWSAFLADQAGRPHEAIRALEEWTRAREYYGALHGHTPEQIAYDLMVDLQDLAALDRELDLLCRWAGIDPAPLSTPDANRAWDDETGDQLALFDPPTPDLRPTPSWTTS